MADPITLDEIVVRANSPYQATAKDYYSGDANYTPPPKPRPPQTFLQSMQADREAAIKKYSTSDGPVKAIIDAAKKGTDYFIIGEVHGDMAVTFKTITDALNTAKPGEIAAVSLELPPTYSVILADAATGVEISKKDFIDYFSDLLEHHGDPQNQASALYDLVLTAKLKDIPLLAGDVGAGYSQPGDSLKERLDDTNTYNYLKQGIAGTEGMVIVHQGLGHVVNLAGMDVKGVDDLASAAGKTVVTAIITNPKTVKGIKEVFEGDPITSFQNDRFDLAFIGNDVKLSAKPSEVFGVTDQAVKSNLYSNTDIGVSGTRSYTGSSKADLFEDVKGSNMKINGGGGTDMVSYARSSSGVSVYLSNPAKNKGNAKGDTYTNVENIYGSQHKDDLRGDNSANVISGGSGNDVLYGYNGNDRLYGGAHNDRIYGGLDNDVLFGESGKDVLFGDGGNDSLYGGADDDILYGNDGNDKLYGENGADKLFGGAGKDTLSGGSGDDRIYGGTGNDTLSGGSGKDIFFFGKNEGTDRILDFQSGIDRIFLDKEMLGYLPGPSSGGEAGKIPYATGALDSEAKVVQQGSDVKITFHSTQIIVDDARAADVKAALLPGVPLDMA